MLDTSEKFFTNLLHYTDNECITHKECSLCISSFNFTFFLINHMLCVSSREHTKGFEFFRNKSAMLVCNVADGATVWISLLVRYVNDMLHAARACTTFTGDYGSR